MKASIIVPAWCWDDATVALLDGAISNIRSTTHPDAYEIIVAYAGIPAGEEVARRADAVIVMNPPQGWAFASNLGLLHARGQYLVVGSIDVRLPDGWLPALIDAAGTDGIASPLDYKKGGVTRRRWDRESRGSFWGALFLFPRSILADVGYFDGYAMRRYADMDWAIRARKAGYRTTRADVRAQHVAPHHALKAHPDPHDGIVYAEFKKRHEGHARLGTWELSKR